MTPTDWTALHGEVFDGARVLVTGGAGFIGLHLVGALLELGAVVTVIDDLSGSDGRSVTQLAAAAGDRLRFVEASVLNIDALAEAMGGAEGDAQAGAELVFHQAAMGSVPRSVKEPRAYHEANVMGTLNVLEAARLAGAKRVMFAASSSAYGESEVLPKVETMPVLPLSPYAATKVAGEAMMRAYANSYANEGDEGGPDTVCLRYFNIFGSRQNANSAYAAVIAAFAKALLAGERPVIYGDGEQSRDFTHVDNAVHANLLAARAAGRMGGEVFNVACGKRVSVNMLATQMAAALGRPELMPLHRPERAGDVKHSLADLARIRKTLGYEPIVDFEPGLAATVDWYATVDPAAG
ncbi:MAG: NAD-dependent epimerase/dehydratase family protein [Algisphaera sp.]